MNPVFIEIFGRSIHWYGVFTALGFLAAVANWAWLARRNGLAAGIASELGLWSMVCGILGARVAFILAHFDHYAQIPSDIIRIDRGGLIYYGGFIGGILGVIALAYRRRLPVWSFGDFAITSVPLAHALGRIGCFFNGCCHGKPTELPWGVSLDGHQVHPTPLYGTVLNVGLFFLLYLIYRRRTHSGVVVAAYLLLYPTCRFFLEYLRGDDRMRWLNLTVAQDLSILLFILGILLLLWRIRQPALDDHDHAARYT